MAGNPWTDLPSQPPYVIEQDREPIARFNATAVKDFRIHTELLPEPFFGPPDASVVFLALNPGLSEADAATHARSDFMEACRRNLSHQPSEYPFLYLDPHFSETPGGYWWKTRLQPLLDEGIELEALSQNIMCVEWFPYHTGSFRALPALIPSQQYSFELVSRAIKRDALIINMRSEERWRRSVPELASHRRQRTLNNHQNVVISRRNYGGDFVGLVDLLRSLPFNRVSSVPRPEGASRDSLLAFAADLIGTTHTPGKLTVVRTSGRLRLEVAADASGTIAVHLTSDDREVSRWLAMVNRGAGPRPSVARADSYEAPAAPYWRYGFIWAGRPDRDYDQEQANVRAFVEHLQRVASERGSHFV